MITALSLSPAVDKIYYVDNFTGGKLYRVREVVKSAGGKGINVARVASILGEKVTLLGFKAGAAGEWLESELIKSGVEPRFIEVPGESRTNNNIIDRATGKETELLEIGPYIDNEAVNKFMDLFDEAIKQISVLVCSGGLPEGIGHDFYRILIEKAKGYKVNVILDSNNDILKEGIKACPDIIKPNLRELEGICGRKLGSIREIADACRSINGSGVKYVVATLGREGALMVSNDMVLKADVPRIETVNTIGSGDSAVAGFATGLYRRMDPEEMLKLGMACAAANTQFREIGVVSRELVERFLNKIHIRKLNL